jgi:hypothetical protein
VRGEQRAEGHVLHLPRRLHRRHLLVVRAAVTKVSNARCQAVRQCCKSVTCAP